MTQHLTQFRHPLFNPDGDPWSENCGPACLAMALSRLGLELPPIPGWPAPVTPQARIDAARYAMFSDAHRRSVWAEKDGVRSTPAGLVRHYPDHLTLVNLEDVENGARNCGGRTRRLTGLDRLAAALARGPVMLAGDPCLPGTHAERAGIDYRGGHFLLVAGEEPAGYLTFDPLCGLGPLWLGLDELSAFTSAEVFPGLVGLALLA